MVNVGDGTDDIPERRHGPKAQARRLDYAHARPCDLIAEHHAPECDLTVGEASPSARSHPLHRRHLAHFRAPIWHEIA
jgi:hypothetical protein